MVRTQPILACRPLRRFAFTMVELLIVIAIMAVLVALTASAVSQVASAQQKSVTDHLLTRLSSELTGQWTPVVDQARQDSVPPQITALAGNDPRRARVLWIKLRLRKEFPVNFDEARNSDVLNSVNPVYIIQPR